MPGAKTEISYHYKNIVSKSLTEVFADQILDFYGIISAPIVRAEPQIAFSEKFIDQEYVDKLLEEATHMSRVFQELEDWARTKGMLEGKTENKLAITKKMLARGMNIKEIAEITELSEKEVQKINDQTKN